mgnify:FL=1
MPSGQYEKIKNALLSIGFSVEEADKQISELGKVIQLTVIEHIAAENKDDKLAFAKDPESYVKNRYDTQSLADIVSKVSGKVISEYFSEVTKDLPNSKRTEFFAKIGITQ